MIEGFTTADGLAAALFVAAWAGYHALNEASGLGRRSLNQRMDAYRRRWMREMLLRDNRIFDAQIMAALQNGTAFFASTSFIALGGVLALLRARNDMMGLMSDLPFAPPVTPAVWELKVLGLAVIFGYAFFKFAWSYRLFNYASILLGAVPERARAAEPEALAAADRAAAMTTAAGRHFNRGQRAFFFALAYLGWFLGPVPFAVATVLVLGIMARRQFGSAAHDAMGARLHPGAAP